MSQTKSDIGSRLDDARVAIVGIGPRGLSVLERLCAESTVRSPGGRLVVHVVDPHPPGSGGVWRTSQPRELLMNTVSAQVTIFTDPSVECEGPIVRGPSLYDWARFVCDQDVLNALRLPDDVRAEAAELGPDTYPSRSFYGHYLRWAFRRITEAASPTVEVDYQAGRAVELQDEDYPERRQRLVLEDGTVLDDLRAVVLAQGHTGEKPTDEECRHAEFADRHGCLYRPPTNPADAALDEIPAGETVILRGLGLNYFDYQSMLTSGRNGRFVRNPETGQLDYHASGQEPRLVAGSRRGVPYHARGANQKAPDERHEPVVVTPDCIERLRRRAARDGDVDFARDIWPLISLEVELVYYGRALPPLLGDEGYARWRAAYLTTTTEEERRQVLDDAGVDESARWSWHRLEHPLDGLRFTDASEHRRWLLDYLEHDIAAAKEGNVDGLLKSALDVLRDLRNEVRLLVDHGGIHGGSYLRDLQTWYTPLNAFLSIGPPVSRIEEMHALICAGVLTILGPDFSIVRCEQTGRFLAESEHVASPPTAARTLIEARLPEIDLRRTSDPLMRELVENGNGRPFRIFDPGSSRPLDFGGLAVTERPYRVVDALGEAHPRRFAYGVPTETVHWATAAGVRPGVNSVTLADSDAIARAVLDLCAAEPADTNDALASSMSAPLVSSAS